MGCVLVINKRLHSASKQSRSEIGKIIALDVIFKQMENHYLLTTRLCLTPLMNQKCTDNSKSQLTQGYILYSNPFLPPYLWQFRQTKTIGQFRRLWIVQWTASIQRQEISYRPSESQRYILDCIIVRTSLIYDL